MKTYAHPLSLAEPSKCAPPVARARVQAPRAEVLDKEYGERIRATITERAMRPVQAKAAVDTGYGDLIAALRTPGPTGTPARAKPARCRTAI